MQFCKFISYQKMYTSWASLGRGASWDGQKEGPCETRKGTNYAWYFQLEFVKTKIYFRSIEINFEYKVKLELHFPFEKQLAKYEQLCQLISDISNNIETIRVNKLKFVNSTYKNFQSLKEYVEKINSIVWLYENLKQELPRVESLLNHASFSPYIKAAKEYVGWTTDVKNLVDCSCTFDSLNLMIEQLRITDGRLPMGLFQRIKNQKFFFLMKINDIDYSSIRN